MSLTILIDVDGTIVDWDANFHRHHIRLYPDVPIIPQGERAFLDPRAVHGEEEKVVRELPGFYRELEPIPGALEGIQYLEDLGHDVFFCSVPSLANETCASDKYWSMREHFGKERAKRLILTKDKTLVQGDYLIDDKPKVEGIMTPTWKHVIFEQSYNVGHPGLRLKSWSDIRNLEDVL